MTNDVCRRGGYRKKTKDGCNFKTYVMLTAYFMRIILRNICIYVQDVKFLWSNLWSGGPSAEDDIRRKIHDCKGSFAFMSNEPKSKTILFYDILFDFWKLFSNNDQNSDPDWMMWIVTKFWLPNSKRFKQYHKVKLYLGYNTHTVFKITQVVFYIDQTTDCVLRCINLLYVT